MLRSLAATVTCVVLLSAVPASALDIGGVDLRVGLRGGANMSYMNEPVGTQLFYSTPYTDYLGLGWSFGTVVNFRMLGFIGVEAGWMRSLESAEGTIELREVRRCLDANGQGPCKRQQVDQLFERTSDHIPLTLQLALPTGVARPFLNLGIDLVVNQTNRRLRIEGRDPLPSEIDVTDGVTDELDQQVLDQWNASVVGQNVLRSGLNPDVNAAYAGFIAGIGVDIRIKSVAIPVEFRANIYPSAGGTIQQRGAFGDPCVEGTCVVGPNTPQPLYNDRWPMQFLILFGLDYRIF